MYLFSLIFIIFAASKQLIKHIYMRKSENMDEVENVIRHIKRMLTSGKIKQGERLPAERRLSEELGVSRSHVREAFQKLEAYGIVKTYPQSGTVITEKKIQLLDSLLTDMLTIDKYDFASLAYVRCLLEVEAARLCAMNRTDEDLVMIEKALKECERKFNTSSKEKKDFAYHQSIAVGSHNPVIASMLLIITPDVLRYYLRYRICAVPALEVCNEHRELLEAIKNQDADLAGNIVRKHLSSLLEFSKNNNDNFEFHGDLKNI